MSPQTTTCYVNGDSKGCSPKRTVSIQSPPPSSHLPPNSPFPRLVPGGHQDRPRGRALRGLLVGAHQDQGANSALAVPPAAASDAGGGVPPTAGGGLNDAAHPWTIHGHPLVPGGAHMLKAEESLCGVQVFGGVGRDGARDGPRRGLVLYRSGPGNQALLVLKEVSRTRLARAQAPGPCRGEVATPS